MANVLVLSALGFLLAVPRVEAQATGHNGEYKSIVSDAVAEFNQGNWSEARALFERAHALQPNARTLRGLGITSFELRHYLDALRELQAALEEQRNPLTAEQRAEVTAVLARTRQYVGTVRVEVDPPTASLLLDGALSSEREFMLNVGDYELAANAPGYRDAKLKLYVDGGQTRTVRIVLTPLVPREVERPHDTIVSPHTDGTRAEPVSTTQAVLGWTAVGLGAAGVAAGVVFEIVRADRLAVRSQVCPSQMDCSSGEIARNDKLTQEARTAAVAGAIGLIAGAALAAGGVVLLLVPTSSERNSQLTFVPQLGPQSAGALLVGRW